MKRLITHAMTSVRVRFTNRSIYGLRSRFRLSVWVGAGVFALLFVGMGDYAFMLNSHAATTDYSIFTSGITGKCLDNYHQGTTNGNIVILHSCNSTGAQEWKVNADGTIQSAGGLCLDNWQAKSADNNPIKLYKCSSTDAAEQWKLINNTLVNPATGKCVDDPAFSTADNTPLDLYTCNGGSNQKWYRKAATGPVAGPSSTSICSTVTGGVTGTDTAAASATNPTNLQVYTGGNNIALVWTMPTSQVKDIRVYRNGTQVATVAPSADTSQLLNVQLGNEYDDNAVTACGTYQYQVRADLASGAVSDFTSPITVTQPQASNSAPVPTIVVDSTGAPDLAAYMSSKIVPLLDTWYPKNADTLAYPTYTPPTSFTINFASIGNVCQTAASGSSGTITCDPGWIRNNMNLADNTVGNAFVHEATHVIQDAASGPAWTIEGGADWGSKYYARQWINLYYPHAGSTVTAYAPGAFLINFMRDNYNANFPRDLNIAIHNGAYNDSIFSKDSSGKFASADQAWQAAIAAYNTATGTVKGLGGKCAEVPGGTSAGAGTKLILNTCSAVSGTEMLNVTFSSGIAGKCLDAYAAGVYASGDKADLWDCNGTNQLWTVNADGTIKNNTNGVCLDNTGGNNADGNPIQLYTCSSTDPAEQWVVSGNTIKNPATGKCLDDPGSTTANGTQLDLYTCNGTTAQQWTPTGATTLSGSPGQQWALTYHSTTKTGIFEITSSAINGANNTTNTDYCMDDTFSGTADGTPVQFWPCTQSDTQFWTKGPNNTLVNAHSKTCLSTNGHSTADGTSLILRSCDGSADQQWSTP